MARYYVYIMTNKHNRVLYTGMTSWLKKRVLEHKMGKYAFTGKYNVKKLVYYACYEISLEAIAEEKRIKGGSRAKKIQLIESMNPSWKDLTGEIEPYRTMGT